MNDMDLARMLEATVEAFEKDLEALVKHHLRWEDDETRLPKALRAIAISTGLTKQSLLSIEFLCSAGRLPQAIIDNLRIAMHGVLRRAADCTIRNSVYDSTQDN